MPKETTLKEIVGLLEQFKSRLEFFDTDSTKKFVDALIEDINTLPREPELRPMSKELKDNIDISDLIREGRTSYYYSHTENPYKEGFEKILWQHGYDLAKMEAYAKTLGKLS